MRVLVGYGESVITPPLPGIMAGYDKRKSLAKGVHDELYVKCLVFKEEEMFVLFSLDLLGVDSKFVDEVKKQIKSLENVPTEYILVCATHTHSGPSEIFWGKDNFNPEYWNFVVSQCKNSFEEAINDLRESTLWYGEKEIYGIGSKRNVWSTERGEEGIKCKFFKVRRGKDEIAIVNFPCHPTVLDESNLYYSKDLVRGLKVELEENKIEKFIFVNGAAGDISTRFYKKESTFEEAERLGRILGKEILGERSQMREVKICGSRWAKEVEFLLKYKKNLSKEEKECKKAEILQILAQINDKRARRDLESALIVLERSDRDFSKIPEVIKRGEDFLKKIKISLWKMGDIVFVGLPFEIYYDTGLKIEKMVKEKYEKAVVLVLGYCGGYEGYIPPSENFSRISYEVIASPFEEDAEEKMLEALRKELD
ncbi:MAG: hypothetical protein PWP75_452 [Caldanaerobacter sp.]|nr:hypothetical protein [Caldanaerobacter sp.]